MNNPLVRPPSEWPNRFQDPVGWTTARNEFVSEFVRQGGQGITMLADFLVRDDYDITNDLPMAQMLAAHARQIFAWAETLLRDHQVALVASERDRVTKEKVVDELAASGALDAELNEFLATLPPVG